MDDMVMAESLIRLWGLCNIPINCELQKTNRTFDTHLKCKCQKRTQTHWGNPLGGHDIRQFVLRKYTYVRMPLTAAYVFSAVLSFCLSICLLPSAVCRLPCAFSHATDVVQSQIPFHLQAVCLIFFRFSLN